MVSLFIGIVLSAVVAFAGTPLVMTGHLNPHVTDSQYLEMRNIALIVFFCGLAVSVWVQSRLDNRDRNP